VALIERREPRTAGFSSYYRVAMRANAIVAARFASQLLAAERGADPVAVTRRLLAVQAQDLRSARLAVRARTSGLSVADFDHTLTDARSLVIGWLNRGTLHLVHREDYWWLHALTTPPLFAGNARRLAALGVGPRATERGVAAVERALSADGPLTRDELRERVRKARVPTEGQALVHVLMAACLRGVAIRGPLRGKQHAYVSAREWLGAAPRLDRDRALAELARRYLVGHAPADERDLAKWAGLPLRAARSGLDAIARELVRRGDGLLELDGAATAGAPRSCLLDQWDPLLVGWRSRAGLLADYPRVDSPEAHYRPFAYAGGRAVATWGLRAGTVELDPFGRVTRAERKALDADARDLVRFLAPAPVTPTRRGGRRG
jgi:winged helix DNA-binding protein